MVLTRLAWEAGSHEDRDILIPGAASLLSLSAPCPLPSPLPLPHRTTTYWAFIRSTMPREE